MTVPFPTPEATNLEPPDADEVRLVVAGLATAAAPATGLTDLQAYLIEALAEAMTGHHVDPREVEPIGPKAFAEQLAARDEQFRMAMLQTMILAELVLVPLPPEVDARIAEYASWMGVDDDMRAVARSLSHGSLGLAAFDFERNGYIADFENQHHEQLHTSAALSVAWQQCVSDTELAARWAALAENEQGTLGRAMFEFYCSRGFVFPGLPGSAPPLLAQHDWVHVVADYGTTVDSEIEVFGLIARAVPEARGFSLLAMVIGLFETGYLASGAGLFESDRGHLSQRGMTIRLADAMRRGALCGRDLLATDWFQYASWPIDDVRTDLGIVEKSSGAIEAGSVGPWSPGGISAFQLEAGRQLAAREGRAYDSHGASLT
jgi:hypothetical protein